MCLYPVLLLNKKYLRTKKNNYKAPEIKDDRTKYITAACGKCIECRRQKARNWQVRMYEEQKEKNNGLFVTLTFNEIYYRKFKRKLKTNDDNKIVTTAIRLFLERIRKDTKKSICHWLITEKGHEGTKRVHLHGIIWDDNARTLVEKHWKYGYIFKGDYVNEKTINYIVKYITKLDNENKDYESKIYTSAGIGKNYLNSFNAKNNKYKGKDTNTTYRTREGYIYNLPLYYKNKIYNEDEKEELWINKLDDGIVYVCGEKVDINNYTEYTKLMEYHRAKEERVYKIKIEEYDQEKYKKRLEKQREYYRNIK